MGAGAVCVAALAAWHAHGRLSGRLSGRLRFLALPK
jgi:hypothetical protein